MKFMKINPYNSIIKKAISFLLFFILLAGCFFYYTFFVEGKLDSHEPAAGFLYPANIIDHNIYYDNLVKMKEGVFHLNGINNLGISIIYGVYFHALEIFGYSGSVEFSALTFNFVVLLGIFLSYIKIIYLLGLKVEMVWLFVFNASLLYFSQLINKDLLTILILFKVVEYSIKKENLAIFLIFVVSFLVRFQLPLIMLVYFLLLYGSNFKRQLFLVYVSLSLLNGFFSRFQSLFIGRETLSDGFSALVYDVNVSYGVGSLLLNPVRLAQYFYSLLGSFNFSLEVGVDVSKIKNIPQILILIFILPYVFKCYFNYNYYMREKIKYVLALIPAFFLVWFFNPTINSRYVMLIVPMLIIVGLYGRKFNVTKVKLKNESLNN
jgi:hypothetical protein